MNKLTLVDYTSIYETALKKGKNQRKLTEFLREHNFDFFHTYTLEKLGIKLNLLPEHKDLEVGVLRLDNEIDPFLTFVFHFMGKRSSSVYIYFNGSYFETIHVPLAHDNHNFRKPIHGYKFPAYMTYDERKDWRYEHQKLKKGTLTIKSSFYKEHEPYVQILKD